MLSNLLDKLKKRTVIMNDGARIAVWDTRNGGVPIVFIHGFPESHFCWYKVFAALPEGIVNHYRVIAYDLRGFGHSSKIGEASLNRFYLDHNILVSSLGLEKYHLVGHDWGGAIGLHVARFHPDNLLSLSVLNTNYWKTDISGMWHVIVLSIPILPKVLLRYWPQWFFNFSMKKAFFDIKNLDDETTSRYFTMFCDRKTTLYWIKLYRNMAKMLLLAMLPFLKKILTVSVINLPRQPENAYQVSTQFIWGEDDTFNPVWVVEDMLIRLKKKKVKVHLEKLSRAGHFVQEEQPEKVAQLLVEHWGE